MGISIKTPHLSNECLLRVYAWYVCRAKQLSAPVGAAIKDGRTGNEQGPCVGCADVCVCVCVRARVCACVCACVCVQLIMGITFISKRA